MDTKALVAIADELYGLDPAQFTAARNAMAKESGELAADIRAFRKPSAAAWMTNLLVRERSAELEAAIALGESLREAQDDGDRDQLLAFGAERRRSIAALRVLAGELAVAHGQKAGAAALDEVAETVQAALADPRAAALVRSGRLVRTLAAADDDLVDAAALPDQVTVKAPAARPKRPSGDLARLKKEADEAEAKDAGAAAARKKADAVVAKAARDADRIAEELRRLEEAARAKRSEREAASDALAEAQEEAESLAAEARSAHSEAVRARRRADAAG